MSADAARGPSLMRRGVSIRLSGDPAHGLLFSGYVLAEAALLDRRSVSHVPTLGEEALGMLSGGALRVGHPQEEYPLVERAECLLVTSSQALDRFGAELAQDGMLLVEESLQANAPAFAIALPLVRTAVESGGTAMTVDLVAAAVVTAMTGAVSRRALVDSARLLLPERGRPAALASLEAGLTLGKSRLRV
jgi:2-oxoglutarate ferredoxin oxidoreductase subunit gamma